MVFRLWCHLFILNSSTSSNYSWTKPFICTPQGLAELKTWRRNDLAQDQNMPASRRLQFTFLAKRQRNATLLSWGTFSSLASWLDTALCRAAVAVCWLRMKARLSFFQRWAPASRTQCPSPGGHGAKGRAALSHKGLPLFWALLAGAWRWPGQYGKCPPLNLPPIDRSVDLALLGESCRAARVFISPSSTVTLHVLL